jgi:hypothetical protein
MASVSVSTLGGVLFRVWLWGFRVLALFLAAMGIVGAAAAATLVALRLSRSDFMPSLSIPFTLLYMVVASVLAYIGIRGFQATLGGNVTRVFANLVQRRGWRANE